ncbi:LTA synthase family protein [Niallia taxi]|uniref:LTA synthase family protein n=1 Tax=Niallia taxi TaxID=2499688 RepID=UPI002E1A83D1|nr:LTA synthase family protein [Niallia taxi]
METSYLNKFKKLNNIMVIYLFMVFLIWLKTYFVQITQFKLGIENLLQQFLLFLNPLGSSLLFLGIALLFKGRKKYYLLFGLYFFLSFLLYANVLYYRFFNDFITLPTLTQTQNFGDVSSSLFSLLKPYDFLFFFDFIMLLILFAVKFIKIDNRNLKRKQKLGLFAIGLLLSIGNLILAETDRPQLLTRGFDRNYIVKYLGLYNYTIYDGIQSTRASAQRVLASSDEITEVVNFTQANYAKPNPEYFGIGKGMNVIYFHLESIQNFVINYSLNGEEVTPFLNSLTQDENTLYFNNFFHQTAQGKTSDAEFMIENSLYGLSRGSAFTTKSGNSYQAAPGILGQQGYTSAVFHGNAGSFWNRNEMYKSLGYTNFFDESYYDDVDPEQMTGYGIMDKPFFQKSVPLLNSLKQPFYAKFITVSNHYPYTMNQEETSIEPATTEDKSVDNYFQTARYADEALNNFFDYLKKTGLYDNSIIIMYGDHYGISENHNTAMEKVIGKEVTPFESAALQRVPLFIRVPGQKGGTIEEYGGQIDLLPTLLHLLGIDTKKYIQFGTDLLSEDHNELVPFRNGDFVSPTISSIDEKFYNSKTGKVIQDEQTIEAKRLLDKVTTTLSLSDKVVNGDLLRFYTPKNCKPINPNDYFYTRTDNDKE